MIAAPPSRSEAAGILSLAQSAFGDLRGLVAGLPSDGLDLAPGEGEWSIRETLAHAVDVERAYLASTQYALTRSAVEPVLMPPDRRPRADPADVAGGIGDIIARFGALRARTDAALADTPDADLARPTMWSGVEVDVRHRLHRFASHIVEHAYQCEKAIRALGLYGGDARNTCRRIGALRGSHEGRTERERLHALDAALAQKAQLATPSR